MRVRYQVYVHQLPSQEHPVIAFRFLGETEPFASIGADSLCGHDYAVDMATLTSLLPPAYARRSKSYEDFCHNVLVILFKYPMEVRLK